MYSSITEQIKNVQISILVALFIMNHSEIESFK